MADEPNITNQITSALKELSSTQKGMVAAITLELLDLDAVAGKLPYHEHNKISEGDWRERIALRQKLIGNRMVG